MRHAGRWGSILKRFGSFQGRGDERRIRQKLLGDDHLLRDAGIFRSDILGGWTLNRMEWRQRQRFWNL